MATTATKLQSSLVINYKVGTDVYGKDVLKKAKLQECEN